MPATGSKVETSFDSLHHLERKDFFFFLKDKKEKDESYGRSEAELDTWTEYFLLLTAFLPTVSFDNHNDPVSQAGKQLLSLFER